MGPVFCTVGQFYDRIKLETCPFTCELGQMNSSQVSLLRSFPFLTAPGAVCSHLNQSHSIYCDIRSPLILFYCPTLRQNWFPAPHAHSRPLSLCVRRFFLSLSSLCSGSTYVLLFTGSMAPCLGPSRMPLSMNHFQVTLSVHMTGAG